MSLLLIDENFVASQKNKFREIFRTFANFLNQINYFLRDTFKRYRDASLFTSRHFFTLFVVVDHHFLLPHQSINLISFSLAHSLGFVTFIHIFLNNLLILLLHSHFE